jgi:hypothetical protein
MSATVTLPNVVTKGFQAFNRSSTITVGNIVIANVGQQLGLDVGFTIKRTLKPNEPNTCDLKIYNLSDASRKALAQASQKSSIVAKPPSGTPTVAGQPVNIIPVQIDAGYVGHTSTIFLGELRSAQSVTDGPDIVTELNTGDGDTATQLQRINQSFASGSTPLQVVQALLMQMGVGNGNLAAVQSILTGAQGSLFQKGLVMKGNAAYHLNKICNSVGIEFSIQGGQAQFLPLGQPVAGSAYVLSPSSGLVGTPTVDTAGIMSCVTFILPGLIPGAPLSIDSMFVQGNFRIVSVEYSGETFGNDWYAKIEAARYGIAP